MSGVNNEYALYYDDFCPLCLTTIKFLKSYVKPLNTSYYAISNSNLNSSTKRKALKDMLLILPDNSYLWGYDTYKKIFKLSSSRISNLFKLLSLLMKLPVIRILGKYIYRRISENRLRCNENCEIDLN